MPSKLIDHFSLADLPPLFPAGGFQLFVVRGVIPPERTTRRIQFYNETECSTRAQCKSDAPMRRVGGVVSMEADTVRSEHKGDLLHENAPEERWFPIETPTEAESESAVL